MKAKYLLTAMALPLLFSCTQDEFIGQEDGNNSALLQNRVKVGKVAFTDMEGADTRFDFRTAKWEDGDMFRLFLMDQWNAQGNASNHGENGEKDNANKTHFMEQRVWNDMYSIVNNFATNVPFYYKSGKWENDDAIVEGNYFAVAPAKGNQAKILNGVRNRRDAWVYINPVQKFDLSKIDEKKRAFDGIEENQFFLGYTQIYRNETMISEENVLQLPVKMNPVLANVDLAVSNVSNVPFKVEKMVISKLDGSPMPTLAYIRPAGNTPEDFVIRQDNGDNLYGHQWNKMSANVVEKFETRYPELCLGHGLENKAEAELQPKDTYFDWGAAFAQPYIVDSYEDQCGNPKQDYYWTIDSWTRTAARSVVEYSYPGCNGFTPYGCAGDIAKPAYEYVIDFTNGGETDGYELGLNEGFRAFISLPHNMYMKEYTFTVYGQQYDALRGRWVEGVIVPKASDVVEFPVSASENDGKFTLPKLDPSSEKSYLEADIKFDAFYPGRSRVVQTANAGDLLNHLQSYYGKDGNFTAFDDNKNKLFYVETLGDFVVTNELVDYVQKLYDHYNISQGSKALIYFTETVGVGNGEELDKVHNVEYDGQLIFPADLTNNHAIDLFYYSKKVNLNNKGTQIINKSIIYDYDKSKDLLYRDLLNSAWGEGMLTDGIDILDKFEPAIANSIYGGIGHITNEGSLTIEKVLVETSTSGFGIYNAKDAVLTLNRSAITGGETENIEIHNQGTMNIIESLVQGTLNNAGVVNVQQGKKGNSYVTDKVINNNDCIGCLNENALLNIEKGAIFNAPRVLNGIRGEIVIATGGYGYFGGENVGRIVVKGQLVPSKEYDLLNTVISDTEDGKNNIGVIEVRDGELKYVDYNYGSNSKGIYNDGEIYVIGKSHVMINDGSGIIDVTNADQEGGYEARSTSSNTFFRFCGTTTDTQLKKIISEENYAVKRNPIILQYPAINAELKEETSKTYTQEELKANVTKILVKENATLNLEGAWSLDDAEYDNNGFRTQDLGCAYDALRVDGKLFVLIEKVLTMKKNMTVVITGKLRGENTSKLLARNTTSDKVTVKVDGSGVFEFAGAFDNMEWTKGSIAYWTVK